MISLSRHAALALPLLSLALVACGSEASVDAQPTPVPTFVPPPPLPPPPPPTTPPPPAPVADAGADAAPPFVPNCTALALHADTPTIKCATFGSPTNAGTLTPGTYVLVGWSNATAACTTSPYLKGTMIIESASGYTSMRYVRDTMTEPTGAPSRITGSYLVTPGAAGSITRKEVCNKAAGLTAAEMRYFATAGEIVFTSASGRERWLRVQ
jgi:hypothetical protein